MSPQPASHKLRFGNFRKEFAALRHRTKRRIRKNSRFLLKWANKLRRYKLAKIFARRLVPAMRRVRLIASYFRSCLLWVPRHTYNLLYSRRHLIQPPTAALSGIFSRLQHSAFTRKLVSIAAHPPAYMKPFSPVLFWVIRQTGLAALGTHLAAGENQRMLSLARILNLLFREDVRRRDLLLCYAYFKTLYHLKLPERIVREIHGHELLDHFLINRVFGMAFLQMNQVDMAEYYFSRALMVGPEGNYYEYRMLGRCMAVRGDYAKAKEYFQRSVNIFPASVMAHQNYAGRYDIQHYNPMPWELSKAGELLIYDALGQHAEELFLRGKFQESFAVYGRLLAYQDRIAMYKILPPYLHARLARCSANYRPELPTCILPYEWVTQFGHIGLLDTYLKRTYLGEIEPANHVLLAPKEKVADHSYLAYYEELLIVVHDEELVAELFPFQRYFGESFMVTRGQAGPEPWVRTAARIQMEWAEQKRGPLLNFNKTSYVREQENLENAGVPAGAWYVGLHVRESGFHLESKTGMSEHRNACIEGYFDAIKEITSRGGYVIRMGDSKMKPLPSMPQVIDYAHSALKSERMDLFLLATCRFLIGTTSGLTTVAQTFGTPTLLVNCISNDWQLWSANTDFVLKRIWSRREKRYLSIGEAYHQPLQGQLVNNILLERHGYEPHSNSAVEIRDAVRYKLDLLEGIVSRLDETHPLMQRYRHEIAHDPYLFGAALPALPFLQNEAERGALKCWKLAS